MDRLREILIETMKGYTGKALNGYSYMTSSEDGQLLTVVSFGKTKTKRIAESGLIVRLVNDKIVIERDVNDKILLDALLQAGIPRNQIILAYAGESAPEVA